MRHLLNTLFITSEDIYLSLDGENVVANRGQQSVARYPLHILSSIVSFSYAGASPTLMGACAQRNISLAFCTPRGRFLARVTGESSGNVLLRRAQYRLADSSEASSELARFFIVGKIANCRTVLLRQARKTGEPALETTAEKLGMILLRLAAPHGLETLRGLEGDAAHLYFGVFHLLVKNEFRDAMHFAGRSRKPPRDEVNCLLSFFYSLLANDIRSALEGVGLDPAVGFLHRERPGRPSLALDVMEEFRPYLADRLALTLVNRQQIAASDFIRTEVGGFILKDKARKTVLTAWQERKREEVEHPFLKEKMTVGMLCHMQARLLARYIRGDMDAYPPFSMR